MRRELWAVNIDTFAGATQGFSNACTVMHPTRHANQRYSKQESVYAHTRGCHLFSQASLRKAVLSFENNHYLLLPVPHRSKAMGNVCQRRREDAIYSTLSFAWAQNEGGRHWERESGVQPVQRHWDSSKRESEREPERKEGQLEQEEWKREQRKIQI